MFRRSLVIFKKTKLRDAANKQSPLGRALSAHQRQAGESHSFDSSATMNEALEELAKPARSKKVPATAALVERGRVLAGPVKAMSDSEWMSLPMRDKRAFLAFTEKKLREAPTEVSEQQRRRYFETTARNPTDIGFQGVTDNYQRLKLGLPFAIDDPAQSLGVTKAMYEAADADLFDPKNSYKLENAMTHFKQMFVDYVNKKREGTSTEIERRRIANLSAELNFETQRHLANMFKYAERKLQQTIIENKNAELRRIEELKERIKRRKEGHMPEGDAPRESAAERTKRVLRDRFGIDAGVATTILREMKAQERFLMKCEVLARLTLKRGFQHTGADEDLDAYSTALKDVYAMDPSRLSLLDPVQYLAAKDAIPPVDWAKRWYERALLLPLQETPEFQTLEKLRREKDEARSADAGSVAGGENAPPPSSMTSLVDKMFLPTDDARLKTVHEQRLRHVAYLHMQSQIKRMRANAKMFAGIEDTEEAATARSLYERLQERKAQLAAAEDAPANVFEDPEAADIFAQLMDLVEKVLGDRRIETEAERHARRLQKVIAAVRSGAADAATTEAYEALLVRKEAMMQRILGLMEKDAREDMLWVQNVAEAERPPLLPIPEPMSYVSAADVAAWRDVREGQAAAAGNPFASRQPKTSSYQPTLLGQPWAVPDKPLLFWGTGSRAVEQALKFAREDAEMRRSGKGLPPPYPCAENPWGWRLQEDVLDGPPRGGAAPLY